MQAVLKRALEYPEIVGQARDAFRFVGFVISCRQDILSSFGVIREVVPETWLCWHVVAASTLDEVSRVFSRAVTFKVSVQLAET